MTATRSLPANFGAARVAGPADRGPKDYSADLTELLDALNWQDDSRELRDAMPYGRDKLGFTEILNTMANLGFPPQIVRTRQDRIGADMLPCLFVHKNDKTKAHGRIFTVPPTGQANGTAYVFKENKGSGSRRADPTATAGSLKWFTQLLMRFRGTFGQILIASLMISLLTLVIPVFMMTVYDKVIGAHSPATLKYLVFGVVVAVSAEYALRVIRSRSLSWFGARIDHIVSNTILESILALPASYTERASVAAQLARLKAFESVREFFTSPLILSFLEIPFTLVLIAAIAFIAGPLVIVPLIVAGLYGLLLLSMRSKLRVLTAHLAAANGERQNIHIETLGKQETLRYAGGFDAWLSRHEKASAEAAHAGYRYSQAISFIDTTSQGLLVLAGLAMIYFGIERIWAGDMSMGAMIAVLILGTRTLSPLQMACTALPRLDQVKRNIEQINRLMDLTPERSPFRNTRAAPAFTGEVEFHNVGLRYSRDADPVYAGLSFRVKPGQLVAIAGSNSTGKSTTLKLVSGLYAPQAGSVRLDGVDIRQIDPLMLRQNIAYVGQEPGFFTATLAENLRFVRPDAHDREMRDALEKAGLESWYLNLPDGLNTELGTGATVLPTSLRPQLALARAYLQESEIMLIDELPYEFLNSEFGMGFYAYLLEQKGKRTILYVTYRQDYIDLADLVVQLHQDGRPQVKEAKND